MNVTKRNGLTEKYNIDKIHQVVEWATSDLSGVSLSDIEMNANLSLRDNIETKEIHQILIKSAQDLISVSNPNYQYVAARLLNMSLRKEVWGHATTPPNLLHHIQIKIDNGIYDPNILTKWNDKDIAKIGSFINHKRDDLYKYAGLQQMVDKYLIKNRSTNEIYETPQFAYIMISMCLFDNVADVKRAYECFSTFKLNLPTPIMAGVRTNIKQFASCVLVDVGDDLNSIFSSVHAIGRYTAARAGIGINIGRLRPINSPIRAGEVIHTGLIPYLKTFEATVKSTSQNGIRGGSATVHVPFWHYEIDDILVLKNNAGTDDNRVRKLDYSIQFCKLFYERLIAGQHITLFSPHEAKGLYDAFGDNEKFEELYLKYENSRKLKFKKKIPASKIAEIFARERIETGRIYSMNIDNVNIHGSWSLPVYMSNLCLVGDTIIDCVIDNVKTPIKMSELDELHKNGKEILVLSKNLDNEDISYKPVTHSGITGYNSEVLEITDEESGFTIKCTSDHQIYTKNRGYVKAGELREDDELDIVSYLASNKLKKKDTL